MTEFKERTITYDEIITDKHNGVFTVILPEGTDFDNRNDTVIRDTLIEVVASKECSAYILDISGVRFMDSTGLGVLVGATKRGQGAHKPFVVDNINNPNPSIEKLFRTTGLNKALRIIDRPQPQPKA